MINGVNLPDLTPDEIKQDKINITKVGDELAGTMGFENSQDLMGNVGAQLNSDSIVQQHAGMKNARAFTNNLLLLCLYQKIEKTETPEYINDFASIFDDGMIANGNSKEYIAQKITGSDAWIAEAFVPSKVSKKSLESYVIQMYTKDASGNKVLSPQGYQFKKGQTIDEPQWVAYFKDGKLGQFISNLREQLEIAYKMFKFNKVAELVTNIKFGKTVVGTATNMFDAISGEFLPLVRAMTFLNTEFNNNPASTYVHKSNTSDLVVIMSSNNVQRLQSGIKSQLFNAQLLDLNGIITDANITCLGNKLVIGDSDTDITVSTSPYVDDTTIIVINRNAVRHVTQIERHESQQWAENMTTQYTYHLWGAIDVLPWGQGFRYTNKNLPTMPADVPVTKSVEKKVKK